MRGAVRALDQLALYKIYRDLWCEHNPSTTIYYRNDDFLAVSQWIWENFDGVGGVSFLPDDNGAYKQAPYEEIDEPEYARRAAAMPTLDWRELKSFETEDQTQPHVEPACAGGACELM